MPYLRGQLFINRKQIIEMTSEQVEWDEYTLLHQIIHEKKDKPHETIVVQNLEAETPIAQEFLDFLQRLPTHLERLKRFELRNFRGLYQPLDKGLFERVSDKTDNFTIGAMPDL